VKACFKHHYLLPLMKKDGTQLLSIISYNEAE
jgi:hypothetical protein